MRTALVSDVDVALPGMPPCGAWAPGGFVCCLDAHSDARHYFVKPKAAA